MRRAELLVLAAGLGGCMKIYPDPELPDVTVDWGADDCRQTTRDVVVTLTGLDDESSTRTETVPCTDLKVTIADVRRERFRVEGALLDLAGNPFITANGGEVDLRNGFDQSAGLYFEGFSNFRVSWAFSSGTCESLSAIGMGVYFSTPDEPDREAYETSCSFPPFSANVPAGIYTVQLRALTETLQVVAVSPETAPVEIREGGFRDLGTQQLTPCGATCP